MALWNEKAEGDELEECPICFVFIAKRKRTVHVKKCYDMYESTLDERGLMTCPLHHMHIFPKKFLNHHLEGNCDGAQNALRADFDKPGGYQRYQDIEVPANFLPDVPDDVLNYHNKKLLYILKKDLKGTDISSNKDIYPDKEPAPTNGTPQG